MDGGPDLFVFSKCYRAEITGYEALPVCEEDTQKLATAMAISGAHRHPQWGKQSPSIVRRRHDIA